MAKKRDRRDNLKLDKPRMNTTSIWVLNLLKHKTGRTYRKRHTDQRIGPTLGQHVVKFGVQ